MVSIIIPAYNRADLLEETLKSIQKQIKINFEIIVVDDNSPDKEIFNVCKENNVKYHKNEANSGAQVSRNKGVALAIYDYIAFIDSDDKWESTTKLINQYNILEKNPNISIVFTSLKYIDIKSRIFKESDLKFSNKELSSKFSKIILEKDIIGTYSSVMIRKKDFYNAGECNILLPARQDWDLWIRLSKIGCAYCINDNYTLYRIHDNQISSGAKRKLDGFSLLLFNHKDFFYKMNKVTTFNIHLFKLTLLKNFTNQSSKYYDELKNNNKIIINLFEFLIQIIIKVPVLKKFTIKKLSQTYLFKGVFK